MQRIKKEYKNNYLLGKKRDKGPVRLLIHLTIYPLRVSTGDTLGDLVGSNDR